MTNSDTVTSHIKSLIDLALKEDLGERGDITSQLFLPQSHTSQATIISRESISVAGTQVAEAVFKAIDPELQVTILVQDGDRIGAGDAVMAIQGSTRSILTAERTALNFLQRLSGIATQTRKFVNAAAGTNAQVIDTRKTTPGWRSLEKAAVVAGGGRNHRMGLYDAIMVKDNHLLAGGDPDFISDAVKKAREAFAVVCIELEVDTLDQLQTYLQIPDIDVILLDNMDPALLTQAVALRNQRAPGVKLEASGGVTLDTIAGIAATGVDFVSVGSLTHSVRSVDLSLELKANG